MRICHLAASHSAFSGRMFEREALSARRAGFDVTIIAVPHRFPADPPDHGCRIVELPKSSRVGKLLTVWRLFRLGSNEECDAYHCHDLASLAAGAALKVLTRRRLIYDAHENYPLTHAANITRNQLLRWLFQRVLLIYEWSFVHFADEVFAVDPLIARKLSAMGANTHVLPNFPWLVAAGQPKDGVPDWSGRRVFIYIGGLNCNVAVLEMMAAVDQLRSDYPDVLLALIGKFEDGPYRRKAEQFVRERRLEDHVFLGGEVPKARVPDYLSRAFAGLIMYGATDNYGDNSLYVLKLMEYMAAGLPIIASSFRGLSLVLRRWHCGLVANPSSPTEIASAMERLLSNGDLTSNFAKAGRRAFETRLHWEAVEPKLLTAYRGIGMCSNEPSLPQEAHESSRQEIDLASGR